MPVNVVWSEIDGLDPADLRQAAVDEVRRARAKYLEYPTTASQALAADGAFLAAERRG